MRGANTDPVRVRPLTDAERQALLHWVKSDMALSAPRLRSRARVILLSSYGVSAYVISLLTPMAQSNVIRWIRRFNAEGLDGLQDLPRSGRPRRESSLRRE